MAFYGYVGDVNNSIPFSSVYPGGRSTAYVPQTASNLPYRNNSAGELSALNQDALFAGMASYRPQAEGGTASGDAKPANVAPSSDGTVTGKPTSWWLMFFVVFVAFVFIARKYDNKNNFSNVRLSIYNGFFLTFFIVLILNFLKVIAAKVKVPGVSELILAA